MKPLVRICPFTSTGSARIEVGLFMAWASAWQAVNPDKIADVQIVPVKACPTPVARNQAVKQAKGHGVDILVMIDDDMAVPFAFFEAAIDFLSDHRAPGGAIGVPYCTAPPNEELTVFEWISKESGIPDPRWKLEKIPREAAARKKGIGVVPSLGTGCIAYDMRVFDKITTPHYDYSYNEDHTAVLETEDCWCHRKLTCAGIPLYVHWDYWAMHWKGKMVGKPGVLDQKHIDAYYIEQAMANILYGPKEDPNEPPVDVEVCKRKLDSATQVAAWSLPRMEASPAGASGENGES